MVSAESERRHLDAGAAEEPLRDGRDRRLPGGAHSTVIVIVRVPFSDVIVAVVVPTATPRTVA